ncbi:MAG TPA: hypothetical protein VF668_01305 [Pyrinomonadaceae bacterium]|jgi:tetratricopeptide (TPR) repeat protein
MAKELVEAGAYEQAREALGELWRGVGERPRLDGIDDPLARARVLLCASTLSSMLGSYKQIEGAQERVRDLLSEAMSLFQTGGDRVGADEAMLELGTCYWRASSHDEARIIFRQLLAREASLAREVATLARLRLSIVERMTLRLHEALRLHAESAALFAEAGDHALQGKHHAEYGMVLQELGAAEQRADYIDRSLIELAAASYHFEQAGHMVYSACIKNELAMALVILAQLDPAQAARLGEAHAHLDEAVRLMSGVKDRGHLTNVRETRAKVFLGQRQYQLAEREARAAARAFKQSGEASFYAEAMITCGTALAELDRHGEARRALEEAEAAARAAGDVESAGTAALTLIETLGTQLEWDYLTRLYEQAAEGLSQTRHRGLLERLRRASLVTLRAREKGPGGHAGGYEVPQLHTGFNFFGEVTRYERYWLSMALEKAEGQPTAAARLLGLRHQTLTKVLQGRHKDLQAVRVPPCPRRRSIIQTATSKKGRARKS